MELISIAFILFLIMDPIGNISSFLGLVKDAPPKRQRWIALREMLIALLVIVGFNYLGEYILSILHFSEKTLRIASGVILFLAAIKILFPSIDSPRANLMQGEPSIVPLAIPLIAGPSLLATVMLFAHIEPSAFFVLQAILIAWSASLLILLSAPFLQRVLGSNGLMAAERLLGMVLVLIAIQRFLEGVQLFVKSCQL